MSVRIVMDVHGRDVIWSEIGGKAVPLPVENIYIRASDGRCFTISPGDLPQPLRPHEPEMIEFWLSERGGKIVPDIFEGEKKSAPATSATDEE